VRTAKRNTPPIIKAEEKFAAGIFLIYTLSELMLYAGDSEDGDEASNLLLGA
jgi:hypothetical protein